MDPISAGLSIGLPLLGRLFGGVDNSETEAHIAQYQQDQQREHDLDMAEEATRRQRIAAIQQKQLTKSLLIGGGVLALGAVGTAVVLKR